MFYVAMFGSPCCPGIFHQRKCTGSVMDISPWPPASHRCLRQHPDLLTCRAYRESTSQQPTRGGVTTSLCHRCVCARIPAHSSRISRGPCIPSRRARWCITPPPLVDLQGPSVGPALLPRGPPAWLAAAWSAASHAFKRTAGLVPQATLASLDSSPRQTPVSSAFRGI